jgi:hypothetical protein
MLPHGLEVGAVFQVEAAGFARFDQLGWSTPGVPGFEADGEYCAVRDGLRLIVELAALTSFSQEVRRVGLGSF